MKKIKVLILVVLASAAIVAPAQRRIAPVKFDEFISDAAPSYFFDEDISFKERVDRFLKQLRLEPGSKVYIVHYRAKISQWNPYSSAERLADRTEWEIIDKTRHDPERIEVIDGGLRDRETIEFWIGPKIGSPPKVTPTYPNSEAVTCPSILLNAQGHLLDSREPAIFSAEVYPKAETSFSWTVSPGKITVGQGTSTIRVDVDGLSQVRVSVVGDAVPNLCVREKSVVFKIGVRPILFDEFGGILETDLRARLDAYLSEVFNNPAISGHVIMYGKRRQPRTLEASNRLFTNHLTFRNFPQGRINIVKGGYRDDGGMEFWLLPTGVAAPPPRPSVDEKFVKSRAGVGRVSKRR